ncbi:MAG: serine/threonine protein kinase [Gemmatimonadetes bacterium]|nr:serine/threonine protein kinase [Gemmatimonadota bacterium]
MPDRLLGRTLGKYRVTRLLGIGGFAWVYEAVDTDLELPVALKVLRPDVAELPDALARFRREATTAARLRHPRIVTVRDIASADGYTWVAMDLHRQSLAGLLAHAPQLAESACIRLGIGVAEALACAHANGVVHRDIKPDNILLDEQGEAVVADFGLARAFSGGTALSSTGQVLGTPQYFSPEQARGLELDGRSDLYALGVMLYRCATGRVPFEASDWYAIARQHIEVAPPSPRTLQPSISPDFEAVILRLLAKSPDDRPATGDIVADMLSALPAAPTLAARKLTPVTLSGVTLVAPLPALSTSPTMAAPAPAAAAAIADAAPPSAEAAGSTAAATAPRRAPARRVPLALVGGGVVVAALAWWLGPWRTPPAVEPTAPPVVVASSSDTAVAVDSTADSARAEPPQSPAGAAGAAPPPAVSSANGGSSGAAAANAPPKPARLELLTDDSAELRIDGRLVARGRWSGVVPTGARIAVRASIGDGARCRAARRDTVLAPFSAGDQRRLQLDVRACVGVRYDVEPRDARVAFRPLDAVRGAPAPPTEVRADSMQAFELPLGRYEVRTSARGCVTITDTMQVKPPDSGGPVTRRLRMICS